MSIRAVAGHGKMFFVGADLRVRPGLRGRTIWSWADSFHLMLLAHNLVSLFKIDFANGVEFRYNDFVSDR